ncbi:MAG: hypothetical protein RJB66_753 [Pseudomonadota bacterium]|jgi:hypothetical protein
MKTSSKFIIAVSTLSLLSFSLAEAKGMGGNHSFGTNFSFASPSQDDYDTLISAANTAAGGISTKPMGQGYELNLQYMYRFSSSMFALIFRPSFFSQSSLGKASNGAKYNYELSGWTFFPTFRLIPLENSFLKFYMQIGLGYGRLNGKIREDNSTIEFSGGNFGGSTGIGAEFCFFADHCFNLEGNFRYLPFERNKATSVNATAGWGNGSLTGPPADGQEVEMENRDLGTTLSGMLASIGYTFYF